MVRQSQYGLENHGLSDLGRVFWTCSAGTLYEEAVKRGEAVISEHGALIAHTGIHTGRSSNDKFIVEEAATKDKIWWGKVNKPISEEKFDQLHKKMCDYFKQRDVFIQDLNCGADMQTQLPVRIVTEYAWHSLFARNMFIKEKNPTSHVPEFTVIDAPGLQADPETDGTNSSTFIVVNFDKRLVLIGGTEYAGEIKKSIFSVMNYLLPQRGILPMHCSANMTQNGHTAVFFGLSGTGKTTLSADASRILIGDDEHGWNDKGVFNFEGGCYAKVINLSEEAEPEIYSTTRTFKTLLENVVFDDESRVIDLDDGSLTENTRASYPISLIPNASANGTGGIPENVIFLTCDAFGVLPPVSKLTAEQAMYHFISGYTAKVAGTEKGVTEPTPNFSPCYGGPFLPLHPQRYAQMLGEKIEKTNAAVWLVNTGWVGGPHGVGNRISIKNTRNIINAIHDGSLDRQETEEHPIFKLRMPKKCPGVPTDILNPKNLWDDKDAYDKQAQMLLEKFSVNYKLYTDT